MNLKLPVEALRTGGRNVREDGAYLLENGREMILFIGQQCPPEWIQQVCQFPSFYKNTACQ